MIAMFLLGQYNDCHVYTGACLMVAMFIPGYHTMMAMFIPGHTQ